MGVLKKGRRKIMCDNKRYVWYIAEDDDSPYYTLNIISEDKKLILAFPLNTDIPYIISKGKVFQGNETDGYWNRYLFPFTVPEIITPEFVAALISWAIGEATATAVEWDGKDIIV